MLNVVMLNVIMLNVIMLNVIMLNVIMLNVIMVVVVAPEHRRCKFRLPLSVVEVFYDVIKRLRRPEV